MPLSLIADNGLLTIPSSVNRLLVEGLNSQGDVPPFRVRRANIAVPAELTCPGVVTDASGNKWVFDEPEIRPEWLGAVGDGTGQTGIGTDDRQALQDMLDAAAILGAKAVVPVGKKFRVSSSIVSSSIGRSGGRVCLYYESNAHIVIRGHIIHDAWDSTSSPVLMWPKIASETVRVSNVHIRYEDGGGVIYPNDAVPPGSGAKAGIIINNVDGFSVIRPHTDGSSITGFQLQIVQSSDGFVNGGMVGVTNFPTAVGSDGLHFSATCRRITCIGGLSNSGDDSLSFTHEGGNGSGTTYRDNCTMEDIRVSDWVCRTTQAKAIKVHIDSTVRNCVVRRLSITNITGTVAGLDRGGGIVLLNEGAAGNLIERLTIANVDLSAGTLPKTDPNSGSEAGNLIYLENIDDSSLHNLTLDGSSNSLVVMRFCRGVSVTGGKLFPAYQTPNLITDAAIASVVTQSGTTRRATFSGSPDLSAVAAALAAQAAASQVYDNKYPIISLSGLSGAGYNGGSFRITAADNTAKTVDFENTRSSQVDEPSPPSAKGSIWISKTPDIMLIDSTNCTVEARIKNPLGWSAALIYTRSGPKPTASSSPDASSWSKGNKVHLEIDGQTFGNAITSTKASHGNYRVVAWNCRTGGFMLRQQTSGSITETYNVWEDSTDYAGQTAPTSAGYARTFETDYGSDRSGKIRGVAPSHIMGTVTQGSASTSFTINAIRGVYAGFPSSSVTPAWLKLSPRSVSGAAPAITYANYVFTVTTSSAPGSNLTWDYAIAPPN